MSPTSSVHVDESRVARDELRSDIAEATEALSEMQQSVLFAKVYDGLTVARIAAELEIAVPTVKTHYLRAVCALRDRLGQHWGP